MAQHFDLCIIGSGSGNSILSEEYESMSVAIVERDVFGGTCLNKGCIPSKMLIYPADLVMLAESGAKLGVDIATNNVRWREIRDRTFGRIDPIAAGGEEYRRSLDNVTVFAADARFVGDKRLQVGDEEITADNFVLAAGAHSFVPDVPGLHDVGFHTSDSIMRIDEIPPRLLIMGGGFIGCELGHVFDAFGSDVTLVARGELLLRGEEHLVRQRITNRLGERFTLNMISNVTSLSRSETGITARLSTLDGEEEIEVDEILVAMGRRPNGEQLGVTETGVTLDDDGYVITDQTCLTDAPNIWALGDIRNPMQLKHLANLEARVVSHNVVHPDVPREIDERVTPHAVFTYPQIGAVGLTEDEATKAGYKVAVATQAYGDTAYGWAMEDQDGVAKLIADRATRLLLGAHVYGPQSSILIQQLVQGMRFGQTVDQMARDVIYPHPALSEVIENALINLVTALDANSEMEP